MDQEEISQEIIDEAEAAKLQILPEKSRTVYDKEFNVFEEWMKCKHLKVISETVLLAYFLNLHNKFVASSLWTKYSMLKSTIQLYKNNHISKFAKFISFLKTKAKGHKPKKSKTLKRYDINKFLKEASHGEFLLVKTALIMGIAGACRCDELINLSVENVQDNNSYLYVTIPDTKTKKTYNFTIMHEGLPVNPVQLCKRYISLRPKNTTHKRFFVFYKNGKCTTQCFGISTLLKIASYLGLQHSELYTGHCMRRSSATLLVNAGANITTLKGHGGWKSATIAEGYIEDSIKNKIEIANKIQGVASVIKRADVITEPSSSTENIQGFTISES